MESNKRQKYAVINISNNFHKSQSDKHLKHIPKIYTTKKLQFFEVAFIIAQKLDKNTALLSCDFIF